eukprot:3939041-Rhodomonas_salina.1
MEGFSSRGVDWALGSVIIYASSADSLCSSQGRRGSSERGAGALALFHSSCSLISLGREAKRRQRVRSRA